MFLFVFNFCLSYLLLSQNEQYIKQLLDSAYAEYPELFKPRSMSSAEADILKQEIRIVR
jgi:hypothetical protein